MGSPIPGLRGMWPYHGGGLLGIPSLVVIRLDLAASDSAFGPAVHQDTDPVRWKERLEGLPADRDAEEGKLSLQIGPSDVVTLQAVGRLPEGFSIDEAAMQAARAFAGDTLSGFADEVAAADHAASPAARLAAFPSPEAPAGPVTDAAGHARPVLADAPGFAVLLGGWGEGLSPDGEWHSLDLEDFFAEGRESEVGCLLGGGVFAGVTRTAVTHTPGRTETASGFLVEVVPHVIAGVPFAGQADEAAWGARGLGLGAVTLRGRQLPVQIEDRVFGAAGHDGHPPTVAVFVPDAANEWVRGLVAGESRVDFLWPIHCRVREAARNPGGCRACRHRGDLARCPPRRSPPARRNGGRQAPAPAAAPARSGSHDRGRAHAALLPHTRSVAASATRRSFSKADFPPARGPNGSADTRRDPRRPSSTCSTGPSMRHSGR